MFCEFFKDKIEKLVKTGRKAITKRRSSPNAYGRTSPMPGIEKEWEVSHETSHLFIFPRLGTIVHC